MVYANRQQTSNMAAEEADSNYDGFDGENKNNKRVNRNMSEKKRRDQFNMLVNELCSMVSLNNKKMDKTTVLKSTISFLKSHQESAVQQQVHEIKDDWKPSFLSNDEFTHLMLEALDSCLIVFTKQGNVLYVSESVTSLLGHLPVDLINKCLYNYIHESEKQNVCNLLFQFSLLCQDDTRDNQRQMSFSCHFLRGSLTNTEEDVYEEVQFMGFQHWNFGEDHGLSIHSPVLGGESSCFCCTVRLKNSLFIREMPSIDDNQSEFTSRHSLEWKFLFLDHRAPPIIGYLPFEVLGTSGYDYYHPDDLEQLAKCHEQLMQTGEGMTCYYRFLTKGQQWLWLRSRYFITYHQWNSKPEFIVCTNTVVSYAKVRHHMKETGKLDDDGSTSMSGTNRKSTRSPSVCSVTSGGNMTDRDSVETSSSRSGQKDNPGSAVAPHLHRLLQQRLQKVAGSVSSTESTTTAPLLNQFQTLLPQIAISRKPIIQLSPAIPSSGAQKLPDTSQSVTMTVIQGTQFLMSQPSLSHQSLQPTSQQHLQQHHQQQQQQQHQNQMQQQPQTEEKTIATQQMQSALFLNPIQRALHDQLKAKHNELQQQIRKQQEELQVIAQQLALAQQQTCDATVSGDMSNARMLTSGATGLGQLTTMPSISMGDKVTVTSIPIQSLESMGLEQQFIPLQVMSQEMGAQYNPLDGSPSSQSPFGF